MGTAQKLLATFSVVGDSAKNGPGRKDLMCHHDSERVAMGSAKKGKALAV